MKRWITIILLFTIFGNSNWLLAKDNLSEAKAVTKVIHSVYQQSTKAFLRLGIKGTDPKNAVYYKQFFSPKACAGLIKYLIAEGTIGPFDNDEDPRFGDQITRTTENDWFNYLQRKIDNTLYNRPNIIDFHAIEQVDSLIKGSNQEYRSEFHLVKTVGGWRIENII